MPRKLPLFPERWRDRHGKLRVYFRKAKGRRISVPSSVGSPDFEAAYQAALAGQLTHSHEKHVSPGHRTLGALVTSYMRSASYLSLRATTKVGYASRIETLRTKHGHRSVAGLTRQRIVSGIFAALC